MQRIVQLESEFAEARVTLFGPLPAAAAPPTDTAPPSTAGPPTKQQAQPPPPHSLRLCHRTAAAATAAAAPRRHPAPLCHATSGHHAGTAPRPAPHSRGRPPVSRHDDDEWDQLGTGGAAASTAQYPFPHPHQSWHKGKDTRQRPLGTARPALQCGGHTLVMYHFGICFMQKPLGGHPLRSVILGFKIYKTLGGHQLPCIILG